jgi:ABC-2 type transport system ATP-binding protein
LAVIETIGLSKKFASRSEPAVNDISLRVERGQVFGFLGPNGSGKTTTIGMIVGIVRPTRGTVRLFDSQNDDELHRVRRRLGGTLEQPNLYPYLSGRDNLRIVADIKGATRSKIEATLKAVNLLSHADRECRTYSLGMKQRLSLAAAMLGDPELLILDEPTNGLDPDGVKEIRELISQLANQGTTIFLSSHILSEVERICTHAAIIKNGRLLQQGTVSSIIGQARLVSLKAGDPEALASAVARYPEAKSVRIGEDAVAVELDSDDTSALNRFLCDQGIYVSELSRVRRSLEDAFVQATRECSAERLEA